MASTPDDGDKKPDPFDEIKHLGELLERRRIDKEQWAAAEEIRNAHADEHARKRAEDQAQAAELRHWRAKEKIKRDLERFAASRKDGSLQAKQEEAEERERIRNEEDAERRLDARLKDLEVGPRHILELKTANIHDWNCTSIIKNWREQHLAHFLNPQEMPRPKTFVLMFGESHCGKSLAAAWLVREIVLSHLKHKPFLGSPFFNNFVKFGHADDLADLARFGAPSGMRKSMVSVPFLVIDDLGTENANDAWRALLNDIIDRRYQHFQPTIITTNLSTEDFKRRYGVRICKRIEEDGLIVAGKKPNGETRRTA